MALRIFTRGRVATNLPSMSPFFVSTRNTSSVRAWEKHKKLKSMQAAMQCDDGVPVYLKKGTPDKVLFGITCGLMLVESIQAICFVWRSIRL